MSDKKKENPSFEVTVIDVPKAEQPIKKAFVQTAFEKETEHTSSIWLEHDDFAKKRSQIIDNSSILPQCITAYSRNIAGFGIGVRYKDDYKGSETAEMKSEYQHVSDIINLFTLEDDTKSVFEQLIKDVESAGIGYIEVIRDNAGLPVEIVNIASVDSVTRSKKLDAVQYEFNYNGTVITRLKKFRKYRQEVSGKTVYFKEFGDPRVMDNRDGRFLNATEAIEDKFVANEILEFKIDKAKAYGDVRWIGCVHSITGAHYAEDLNLNYFKNGRHTPLAICIENGRLTPKAMTALRDYAGSIRGENAQHAFLLIETEPLKADMAWNTESPPKITLKDLGSVLQKDELFGEYIDNSRRKVQSSFNLPDIYVGHTTDFNRATAFAAMSVTEDQVFKPYRQSLEWLINNKLLNEYSLKYCEAYFKSPDLNDVDDIAKVLNATGPLGGVSANLAKEIVHTLLGKECEDYDFEGADLPLSIAMSSQEKSDITNQINQQIEKAENDSADDIVPLLKALLFEFKKVKAYETSSDC